MKIDICLSPALFPTFSADTPPIVVVIDIFRATTCMCVAFENGVNSILPIADLEKAIQYKQEGYIVSAERNALKCSFADLGNSPYDYMDSSLKGRDIIMTTTNGTQAIDRAQTCDTLLIGSFSNFNTICDYLCRCNSDILFLCAGWNNKVNMEDTLFAGAAANEIQNICPGVSCSDTTRIALSLWKEGRTNLKKFLEPSEHIQRLQAQNLQKDIDFCLTLNTTRSLPFLEKESGLLKNTGRLYE